jgi:sec-independent protein translocase protein TatC
MNNPIRKPPEPYTQSQETPGIDDAQPLVAHLTELRDRLLRSILAVLLVFLVLMNFSNELFLIVSEPMRAALPPGTMMIATDVAAPFLTPFKLSFYVALLLAVPYVLHQIWSFVSPGLYRHEKRLAAPLLISSVVLFYCGVAFAHFVVLPLMFKVLSATGPAGIAYTPDITRFLDITLKLFLGFGVAFEVPVATVLLILSGATTPQSLAGKRPYIIVGCFIIGAILTPPDAISQCMMAIPMWLLFELGILVGRLVYRPSDDEKGDDAGGGDQNDGGQATN